MVGVEQLSDGQHREANRAMDRRSRGEGHEQGWSRSNSIVTSLLVLSATQPMVTTDWQTLVIIIVVIIGVLLGPYELLLVLQRVWEQRRRERIARGEDVRPEKLPWDEDD